MRKNREYQRLPYITQVLACGTLVAIASTVIAAVTSTESMEPTGTARETPANAIPYYYIAIHNEPDEEDLPQNFQALVRLTEAADEWNMKLTLMFSPSWVDYILSDPGRSALLEQWRVTGHEFSSHHHSIHHGGTWDGYSFTPEPVALAFRESMGKTGEIYRGTLEDYMAELRRLDVRVNSGCHNEEIDKRTMADGVFCGTCSGYANFGRPGRELKDTEPAKGRNDYLILSEVNGVEHFWLGHAHMMHESQLAPVIQEFDRLDGGVYGTVAHSVHTDADSMIEYMRYLHEQDPEGAYSVTLHDVIDRQLLPIERIEMDELGLLFASSPLIRGRLADLWVFGGTPGKPVRILYSLAGPEPTYIPILDLVIDLEQPIVQYAVVPANEYGVVRLSLMVPNDTPLGPVWLQAVEQRNQGDGGSVKSNHTMLIVQP